MIHPKLQRKETAIVFKKKGNPDVAGYRTLAQQLASFQKAGLQLQAFRAAEFSGDLELNPLHRQYVDPVDRDEAIAEAIQRGKKAKEDFEKARGAALDRRKQQREDEIVRIAERIRRRRDGVPQQTEGFEEDIQKEVKAPAK